MYRIVIADDESIVRDGMRDRIDWERHGFELVGVCPDGRAALSTIEETRPHIVLADIYMPFMNGLDLSGAIAERFPETRVVLLTGYDRIDYAQEAVRKQVSDFLLKPITPRELRKVLDRMKLALDRDTAERERRGMLEAQLAESVPLLRERALNGIIRRDGDPARIDRAMQLCGLTLSYPNLLLAVLDRDERESSASRLSQGEIELLELEGIVNSLSEGDAEEVRSDSPVISFRTTEGALALVFGCEDGDECSANALAFLDVVVDLAHQRSGLSVSAGIARPVTSLENLPLSYEQAREALAYRYHGGGGMVSDFRDLGSDEHSDALCDHSLLEEIATLVKTSSLNEINEAIDDFVRVLREGRKSEAACRAELLRLYLEIAQAATALGIPSEEIVATGDSLQRILDASTLDQAHEAIRSTVKDIHSGLESRRARRSERLVLEAKEFIRAHSTRPDLQLSDVIREVGASSSYFSQVFKNHTGQTFVEYLTYVRVDHAKALMRTGMDRMYEIAEAVGYRDPHYFSMVFKKCAGMTATRFRKLVEHDGLESV